MSGIRSSAAVRAVAVSPDGTRLATGGMDNYVRVWDTASGRQLPEVRRAGRWVTAVAFSPDGTRLATGSGGKAVRIWSAAGLSRDACGRGSAAALPAGHHGDACPQTGTARYRVSSLIVHRQNQRSACGFLLPRVPPRW